MDELLPIDLFDRHVAIVGRTGSGKSYAARGIVEGWLMAGRRVCVIDPTDVWYGLRANAAGDGPGFPVVVFGGEHGDVPIGEFSGDRIAEIIAGRNLPAVIATAEMAVGERHRFMTGFLGTLFRLNKTPLHLVLDEADDVAPQNPLPENRRMLGDVERIVRRGRVRGFRVMMITQRSAVLNKNILTQASVLIAMRLPAKQDRDAIEGWIKGQADSAPATEVLGSLSRLQRGEGWVWAPEQGVLTRQTFPPILTFDSMRTPEHGEELSAPTGLAEVELGDLRALLEESVPATAAPRKNDIEAAEQRGYERGRAETEAQWRAWVEDAAALVGQALAVLHTMLPSTGGLVADLPNAPAPAVEAYHPDRADLLPSNKMATAPSGVEARILGALAELDGVGISEAPRVQVAFLAGYRNLASKGFANGIGSLHTRQLVSYPAAGRISLTEAGRALAPIRGKALDNAELQSRIFAMLSGPERRILRILIDRYPGAPERSALGHQAGYSNTASKGFANGLGRLRSLGFIDYPTPGRVVATGALFATEPIGNAASVRPIKGRQG